MLSAQRVRLKQRSAVARREGQIEDDELESGEINLIPYLDIVTNLMLFILASVAANVIFGQINTTLPDQGAPPTAQQNDPNKPPDEQPLGLAVAVTRDEILVFSFSGLEGTLAAPKARIPRTGKPDDQCDAAYQCETNKCGANQRCVLDTTADVTPVFNYRQLNDALAEIATRRWTGPNKPPRRKLETYQAVLMADPSIPYGTLVSVISSMRCRMGPFGKTTEPCLMPTGDETLKTAKDPVDQVARLFDPERVDYDPTQHALFSDVVFSTGFR
ncbi:MAG: biopolymer transporter ExbD [Myxococcales bacterium]|nr:biopolymer transporter ExbD [Myxococcales bacterium]